jgi:hypothetical protein
MELVNYFGWDWKMDLKWLANGNDAVFVEKSMSSRPRIFLRGIKNETWARDDGLMKRKMNSAECLETPENKGRSDSQNGKHRLVWRDTWTIEHLCLKRFATKSEENPKPLIRSAETICLARH